MKSVAFPHIIYSDDYMLIFLMFPGNLDVYGYLDICNCVIRTYFSEYTRSIRIFVISERIRGGFTLSHGRENPSLSFLPIRRWRCSFHETRVRGFIFPRHVSTT